MRDRRERRRRATDARGVDIEVNRENKTVLRKETHDLRGIVLPLVGTEHASKSEPKGVLVKEFFLLIFRLILR